MRDKWFGGIIRRVSYCNGGATISIVGDAEHGSGEEEVTQSSISWLIILSSC